MCYAMVPFEEFEFLTRGESITLPAALNVFVSAAIRHLAIDQPASFSAGLSAPQLCHCPQHFVAFFVVGELSEEWNGGEHLGHIRESVTS
jgi:hypothetical protein